MFQATPQICDLNYIVTFEDMALYQCITALTPKLFFLI